MAQSTAAALAEVAPKIGSNGNGHAKPASPAARMVPRDPAAGIPGMPPNLGKDLIPHIITHQGIVSSAYKVYRPSDEALRDSWENARFMRNDPMIRECVDSRVRSCALLNWHLEPENAKSHDEQELCRVLTDIVAASHRFMQYRENLAGAIWPGRAAAQHRFQWDYVGGRQRIVLKRWLPVNGDKLVFRFDDGSGDIDPDQVGIRVGMNYKIGDEVSYKTEFRRGANVVVEVPKVTLADTGLAYFLDNWQRPLLAIHKHQIEDGYYEDPLSAGAINGVGIRSVIYWTWMQKQNVMAALMEYLDRSALGVELWYYPWGNNEAREKTRTAAEERIGGGRNIILIPRPMGDDADAYGVDHIEPGLGGVEALERIIKELFAHQIKRYILGQVLTSEAESTGLGSGVADAHIDTLMQIVRYDSTNLEETITEELVAHLKNYNFPAARKIRVKFRIDTSEDDMKEKLEALRAGWEMGLKLKAQDLYDTTGASQPDPGDEVLQHPQFQQMGAGQPGASGPPPGWQPHGKPDAQVLQEQLGAPSATEVDRMRRDREAFAAFYRAIQEKQPAQPVNVSVNPQIHMPQPAATEVHVGSPSVHLHPQDVRVQVPAPEIHVAAPEVHVESPTVSVESPGVSVEVAAPNINNSFTVPENAIQIQQAAVEPQGTRVVTDVERDAEGKLTSFVEETQYAPKRVKAEVKRDEFGKVKDVTRTPEEPE